MPIEIPVLNLEFTAFTKTQIAEQNAAFLSDGIPQIAVAGRSNVGKSSLINAMANRKALAKTGATPGKTRSVNYYSANSKNKGSTTGNVKKLILADLPGYGYARCSMAERNAWKELIEYYFETAKNLCAVAILLDCRLEPQESDKNMVSFAMAKRIRILPVLTKCDKCSSLQQSRRAQQWEEIINERPVLVSSVKKQGIGNLWGKILEIVSEQAGL